MLTKQEQEILDNAPDGATHYMKHDIHGIEYAVESESGSAYIDASNTSKWFLLCEWKATSLSDLRKRQGKTVVDAVNYFKGVDSSHGWTHIITPTKANKTHEQGIMEFDICNVDNKYWDDVCTIEEFNQCVKEMSEIASANELMHYRANNSPLEPIKPRMKVEYVRVADSIFHLQPDLEAGELYCNTCDGYEVIDKELTLMSQLYKMNVYREVETEITWLDELIEFAKESGIDIRLPFDESAQYIEASIMEESEFIDMCHLVSRLNK